MYPLNWMSTLFLRGGNLMSKNLLYFCISATRARWCGEDHPEILWSKCASENRTTCINRSPLITIGSVSGRAGCWWCWWNKLVHWDDPQNRTGFAWFSTSVGLSWSRYQCSAHEAISPDPRTPVQRHLMRLEAGERPSLNSDRTLVQKVLGSSRWPASCGEDAGGTRRMKESLTITWPKPDNVPEEFVCVWVHQTPPGCFPDSTGAHWRPQTDLGGRPTRHHPPSH